MKTTLFIAAIALSFNSLSQGKKEMEDQVTDLNNQVNALTSENEKLQSDVTTYRTKYEEVLTDRVEQEKEIGELNHKIDSMSSLSGSSSGSVKLVKFTNNTATFTVPAGKTWEIINVFGERDYSQMTLDGEDYDRLRVHIKSLNGNEMTNVSQNKIGPTLFRGGSNETALGMPLILPEKTTITLVILSAGFITQGWTEADSFSAYLNYVER